MIQLINISKKYKDKVVLQDITYEFNDSGLYFITGKSGSGKTTLLNLISGNIEPSDGHIIYDNINSIYEDSYYIYQDFNLLPSLSVLDNIKLVLKIKNKIFNESDVLCKLESVGLKEYLNKQTKYLSGGERQRLSIVIGLLLNSKVILLDEPTSSLDRENANNIISYLRELSTTTLIIIATHDLSLINSNDIVIDLYNFKSIHLEDNIIQKKDQKLDLGFNTFYVKNKMMKKDILRSFFQIIFLTFLLISLTLVIPFSNMSYSSLSAREITNGNNNLIIDLQYKNMISKSQLLNEVDVSSYSYNIGKHANFTLTYNNKSFDINNIYIDENLTDDEIIISSEIESSLSTNSLLNEKLLVDSFNLKVIDIEQYQNISSNESDYNLDYLKLNYKTYAKIDNWHDGEYFNDLNYFYGDASLEYGTCTVTQDYYNSYLKDKNIEIGDTITLTKLGTISYNINLKLANISDKNSIDKLTLYQLFDQEYPDNCIGINVSHLTNYKNTKKLIHELKEKNITFYYNNASSVYFISQVFDGLDILLKVLIPILLIFSIFLTFYISYNMFKTNKRSFNVLSLLGVSKNSILTICMIDNIECIIISIILSIYPIVYISNYFMNTLKVMNEYKDLNISFNIFQYRYLFLSAILVFITLSIISFIFNLLRSTKSSYIND